MDEHRGRGSRISVMVDIGMPDPGTPATQVAPRECSPEESIRRALDLVESGHESATEWNMIRNLNNKLMRKYRRGTISPRELSVLRMMQPIIEKYGQFDPEGVEQDATLHSSVDSPRRRGDRS